LQVSSEASIACLDRMINTQIGRIASRIFLTLCLIRILTISASVSLTLQASEAQMQ
jgi:hypothetical protein